MNVVLIVMVLIGILSLAGVIITNPNNKNNKLYCRIFEHEDWVKWEKVCQVLPELKLSIHYVSDECEKLNNYKFALPDIGIDDNHLMIIYWETTNEVSVHRIDTGACILSPFDRYHSNRAVEILKQRI